MGKCKYCGKSGVSLVKSHIIPEGLYWGLDQSKVLTDIVTTDGRTVKRQGEKHKKPKMISIHEGEYPKARPNGLWDKFLCNDCEEKYKHLDDYAIKILRDQVTQSYLAEQDFWLLKEIDYTKLKLFFISLLWRTHATKEPFFEKIEIGLHADLLKGFIETQIPGHVDDFSVLLWHSEELMAKVIIEPSIIECAGILFVRIYLPGYMALIKIDKKELPEQYRPFALSPSGKWKVRRKDYSKDGEVQKMYFAVKTSMERKNG